MLAVKLTTALVMNLTLKCFRAGIELKLRRKHFVCLLDANMLMEMNSY